MTGARHVLEADPGAIELVVQHESEERGAAEIGAAPRVEKPLRGWSYEVAGHGWVYTGELDEEGRARVRVGRGAKAPYEVKVTPPPPPPRVPPRVELDDPGKGPAATRRQRTVTELVARLRARLTKGADRR